MRSLEGGGEESERRSEKVKRGNDREMEKSWEAVRKRHRRRIHMKGRGGMKEG